MVFMYNTGTGTGSIQSYMSPYQSAVRDATLAEYDTQAAAQRSAVTQQAGLGTVGNLDSGRFGVQLGAFDAQRQRDRALLDAQLGQQGFNQQQGFHFNDIFSQMSRQQQQSEEGVMEGDCLELLGTMWVLSSILFIGVFCYEHWKLYKK